MAIARKRDGTTGESTAVSPNVQKSNCRFQAGNAENGKPTIELQLFHQTVSCLAGFKIEFELIGGTTSQQANALAEAINDRIISIVVAQP
jgi:hypothetical protein